MKLIIKQIAILERVDQLIRLKATGRPRDLAKRLEVSEATIFRIIDTMKEMNAPIYYDLARQSYLYSDMTTFKCGFYLKELDDKTEREVYGGCSFVNLRKVLKL